MDRRTFNQLFGAAIPASGLNRLFPSAPLAGAPASAPSRAYCDYNPARRCWTLGNAYWEREMGLEGARGLAATRLVEKRVGYNWLTTRTQRGSDVYVMLGDDFCFGPSPAAGFQHSAHKFRRQADASTRLEIRFSQRPGGIELTLFYRWFDDSPFLEQWCRLRNTSDQPSPPVGRFDPFFLPVAFPAGSGALEVYYLNGIRDYGYQRGVGEDIQPFAPYRLRRQTLRPGSGLQLNSSAPGERYGRKEMGSTHYFNWFALHDADHHRGLTGALQWEGAWTLNFDCSPERAIHLYGGVNKCTHVLPPGGTLESPRAFYAPFHGELDDGLAAMHCYLRRYLMPANPDENFPWVNYNTWIPYLTGISAEVLKPELDIAQQIGVECFYLDAGWCEHMDLVMDGGLGNWVGDRAKFPGGIAGFSEDVHRRGMKFALWVEPERANLRFVGKEIPERWVSKHDGFEVGLGETVILCFGDPEVRAWAKGWLERIISDFKVDWLRWDLNAYNICERADHGHQAGDGDFMHVSGVHEVMAFLRQRFPKLVLENCAGGGNRFGFGMMRYAQTTLNSDVVYPSYRARYQVLGCSHPFPAQYQLTTYVKSPPHPGGGPAEPVDTATSSTFLDYLFRSKMMGTFGISDRMIDWPPNERAAAAKAIRDYKKLRAVLAGEAYHLLPQPLIITPPMHPSRAWEAIQYYNPRLDSSVIFCFRERAEENRMTFRPRGLAKGRTYRVRLEDAGHGYSAGGEALSRDGIAVSLPEMFSSEIIWITSAA